MPGRRDAAHAAAIGAVAGAVIAAWNLIGMYSTIPVAAWDVVRQALFIVALAGIIVVAARATRAGGSWGITGLLATVTAVACAATVLGTHAVSTMFGTDRIRQVPEFIRDYTNNGYTSPAVYFADHYAALLQLEIFVWLIAVAGMAAVGTVMGRVAARMTSA